MLHGVAWRVTVAARAVGRIIARRLTSRQPRFGRRVDFGRGCRSRHTSCWVSVARRVDLGRRYRSRHTSCWIGIARRVDGGRPGQVQSTGQSVVGADAPPTDSARSASRHQPQDDTPGATPTRSASRLSLPLIGLRHRVRGRLQPNLTRRASRPWSLTTRRLTGPLRSASRRSARQVGLRACRAEMPQALACRPVAPHASSGRPARLPARACRPMKCARPHRPLTTRRRTVPTWSVSRPAPGTELRSATRPESGAQPAETAAGRWS